MKGINSVVTRPAEAPAKENKRKAAASKEKAAPQEKKPRKTRGSSEPKKSAKDPNAPKRPTSSYFLFMADFRAEFKKSNPGAKPTEITKAGGEEWKSMSDADKAPYNAKHAELKANYPKLLAEYEQKSQTATEGSGETKSEITDDADSTLDVIPL